MRWHNYKRAHYGRINNCNRCDEDFTARSANALYCPACRVLMRQEYSRARLERQAELAAARRHDHKPGMFEHHWRGLRYEVARDETPDECLRFKVGARFDVGAMAKSLEFGVLNEHMLVRDRHTDIYYEVRPAPPSTSSGNGSGSGSGQILKRVGGDKRALRKLCGRGLEATAHKLNQR